MSYEPALVTLPAPSLINTFAAVDKEEPPDATSQPSDGMSSPLSFLVMLFTSPAIGATTASGSKDAEVGEEDNPADPNDNGEDSESLFGGTFFPGHLPLPAVYIIVHAICRSHSQS